MFHFIDNIADYIKENHRDNLKDLKVLFPNHRAVLFLRKRLAEKMDTAYINPEMLSIDNLVNKYCNRVVPDRISLIHLLYNTMRELGSGDVTFAHFYSWGDKLINDFDLIDKYLVDPEKLFKTIDDIHKIENQFNYLDEDLIILLKEFWGHVNSPENKTQWKETWSNSGELYFAFKRKLKANNCAYPGMKYRYVAENLNMLEDWEENPVIIAGFNRLSTSEDQILNHLKHASFFWDVDRYYYSENEQHIAGKYMRRNIKKYGMTNEISDYLHESEKNITVLNLPNSHTQSQAAMQFLKNESWEPEKTMILLSEENQLLPLLTIIPEEIQNFNISMGWHISESPIAAIIDNILELHLNYDTEHKMFSSLQVLNLLRHPYILKLLRNSGSLFNPHTELTPLSELEKYGKVYEIIFKPLTGKMDIFDRLLELVEDLFLAEKDIHREEEDDEVYLQGSGVFLAEILKYVHQKLIRLKDIFQPIADTVNLRELSYLFRQIFRNTRIPFTGEPLSGMQILGPLEARSLDYDNIIVCNMKEGSWPPSFGDSTIPFSLRKAYGIPVIDDEVAEYSYYFWSLLPRTRNLLFLNPADTAGFNPQSKSRFLLELETLKNHFSQYQELTVNQELHVVEEADIVIEKDAGILEKLNEIKSRHLSASAILEYTQCSLKFCFNKILGLKKKDDFEKYSYAKFGTVLHDTMENLYLPYKGELISDEIIDALLKRKTGELRKHYREEFRLQDYQIDSGTHLFYMDLLEKHVEHILEYDRKRLPYELVDCELEFLEDFVYDKGTGETVKIKGYIDRVDRKDGKTYIIDYKTGKLKDYKLSYITKGGTLLSEKRLSSNAKNIAQVLFYSFLMQDEEDEIVPQLYGVYEVQDFEEVDDATVTLNKPKGVNSTIEQYNLDAIEEGFGEKIGEIFDTGVPFKKTENEEFCKYCDFKFICNR